MSHIRRISYSIVLMVAMFLQPAGAYQLTSGELDKLSAAQRLAARVFQETKDAAGAAKVLEEAGVQRLEKGRPANMAVKTYLDFIEDYAGYLARTADAGDAAADYLKTVIQTDPARASAFRSLGELYYRKFQTKADPQYRRIYQAAFSRYVERVIAEGRRVVLPQYIIEAVYPQAGDVCMLLRALNEQQNLSHLDLLFNPERDVVKLDPSKQGAADTANLGASFEGFSKTVQAPIIQSLVDIDNDSVDELRFSAATADGCRRNLFYKKFGEQSALLSNKLLDEYYGDSRICGGGRLYIIHVNNVNYIVERQLYGGESDLKVFELRPSGEFTQRCRVSPPTPLEQNLVSHCEAAVCKQLAGKIDKIVATDGQAGSEWLVSDIAAQKFAGEVTANPGLTPFVSSPHQYLADLDNDGEKELIARLWRTLPDGNLEYQYRLFKKRNGLWQVWTLPIPDSGVGPGPWQWFFIEPFENINYIVAYTASHDQGEAPEAATVYSLVVYLLKENELSRLGELRTQQPRHTTDIVTGAQGVP